MSVVSSPLAEFPWDGSSSSSRAEQSRGRWQPIAVAARNDSLYRGMPPPLQQRGADLLGENRSILCHRPSPQNSQHQCTLVGLCVCVLQCCWAVNAVGLGLKCCLLDDRKGTEQQKAVLMVFMIGFAKQPLPRYLYAGCT